MTSVCLAEDNLEESCSDSSHFCCEANGKVVKVVLPQDIYGDYSFQNAQAYCEKNYAANVSLNTSEYDQTVSIKTPDQLEVVSERYLEID